VLRARETHPGGATVLRRHARFRPWAPHPYQQDFASRDLPVVVEIAGSQERIDAFFRDHMMSSGLVTMEKAQLLQYGAIKPE
jgi:PII-like signaling protein